MEKYKGEIVTISEVDEYDYSIEEDIDNWNWTDEMLVDIDDEIVSATNESTLEDKGMTVVDLLNKIYVEQGGLVICVYHPSIGFKVTIGHNYICRNSELYKRFIEAYGDMIVNEINFDVKDGLNVIVNIKIKV
jgi:hypothetical protein